MRTVQGNMLTSLHNVQDFLDENADKLSEVVKSGAKQRLVEVIALLEGHANDQEGHTVASQGATKTQRALRAVLLRDHMAKIASIARAELPKIPAIESLRMPRGKPTPQKLKTAAYAMAQTAEQHADVFIAAGLPADFVARLTRAADDMLASLFHRSQNLGKRTGATDGLKSKLSAGRKIVRVLDTFVKSALKDDPALLGNWGVIKRVQGVGGRTKAATTPAPTPPPTPEPPPTH